MPQNLHMLNIFCTFAVDLDGKEMTSGRKMGFQLRFRVSSSLILRTKVM